MPAARPLRAAFCALCALLLQVSLEGWTPEKWFDAPRSDRAVHYEIKAVLDWQKKQLEGRMRVTWRNTGTSPAHEMPFQLHLNAFRSQDAIIQRAGGQKINKPDPNSFGHCEIVSVSSNGIELSGREEEDDSVFWVSLPKPVLPGQSMRLEIAWTAKFPEIQSGIGWTGRFLVASAWYPKLGYYAGNEWVCGRFRPNAAPQGHFGNYDVELSLPNALQLANTGTVLVPLDESGGPLTDKRGRIVEADYDPERKLNFIYRIHAEDVHDFGWAAAPKGSWRLERRDFGDTQVFFYSLPRNGSQLRRLKEAAWSALRHAERTLGPYPYPVLSIVDLPRTAATSGANSSPTLAMLSSVAFDPFGQHFVPEQATVQQIGEQFFRWVAADSQGSMINDELIAWFVFGALAQESQSLFRAKRFALDATFPCGRAKCNPFSRSLGRQGRSIASKALWQLEAKMGKDAAAKAIRGYFSAASFKHADDADFLSIAQNDAGLCLDSWSQAFSKDCSLDYRIRSVGKTPDGNGTIEIERIGIITAPIELRVCLENGKVISRIWDGEERLTAFTFDSPISSAALDTDWKYPSLENRLGASYSASPARRGVYYWAGNVVAAICGILQGIGVG
jgi:hypothetical protein